ncbi:DUF6907 domain-containing protein [Nocardia sp. NPDC004260]
MPKNSSSARRTAVRQVAAQEGITYTAALRKLQAAVGNSGAVDANTADDAVTPPQPCPPWCVHDVVPDEPDMFWTHYAERREVPIAETKSPMAIVLNAMDLPSGGQRELEVLLLDGSWSVALTVEEAEQIAAELAQAVRAARQDQPGATK